MSEELYFRPARRSEAKPLIGFYSESNGGKTYSALLLARGFVGPQGKIGMIETESGRGESYADPQEYPEIGGYEVLSLRSDFSPETYGKALRHAEKLKIDALIIDSASHEWEGAGGVLDMASKNEAAGKKSMLVWQKPKIDHQRHFMLPLLQTPIPLIIMNMRAKYPMEQVVKDGKKDWARSTKLEPIQSDGILFELFIHGWMTQDHNFHIGRLTNRSLDKVFEDGKQITLDTGKRLAAWASGRTPIASASLTPAEPAAKAPTLAEAKEAAGKGTDHFRDWWRRFSKDQKTDLVTELSELQTIAEEADRKNAEQA